MLSITMSRAAVFALVILPTFLVSAAPADAATFTAGDRRTEMAANPDQASSEGGITGQVSIRPVRPHATIGVPNLAPYRAKLEVLDSNGNMVSRVETDANGNFRIALPPGKYLLRPQSSGPYPRASEQTVVVPPKSFAQVRVVYDSGIR